MNYELRTMNYERYRQDGGPFVIAVGVAVCLAVGFAACTLAGSGKPQKIELASLINPNVAPAESLVRLPGIGITRAEAFVAYRNNFAETKGNKSAFETIDDLQKVKGIGPKTTQNISKWLKFE